MNLKILLPFRIFAEKTGVSLETLNDLNPDADTLSPGQKLRLRR